MEKIHMWDIISLLGIPYPSSGQSSYYVQCPCCDENPRKKHLNINLKKEVFRCPRCGASGGIFDLYALYTGIPRDEVRKAILARMGVPENASRPRQKILPKADTECPLTDIDARHATYRALLSKLTLASDHKENLLGRGLTDADIERLGYKTTPVVGMAQIAKQLQSDGLYLAGVPGFYRDDSGAWTFIHEKRGILIPARDRYGRIQGLQIRRDNVEKRKFRWVSSTEKKDGCNAEGWTHLSGPVRPMLVLTEGPMKADVINALTGLTVLAVPGVNTLTQLELTLTELRSEGLVEIKTAFDMDFATNHHVQNGYNNLLQLLGGNHNVLREKFRVSVAQLHVKHIHISLFADTHAAKLPSGALPPCAKVRNVSGILLADGQLQLPQSLLQFLVNHGSVVRAAVFKKLFKNAVPCLNADFSVLCDLLHGSLHQLSAFLTACRSDQRAGIIS